MEYLADTDLMFAQAKMQMMKAEILAKRVRARVYVTEEGAVELRKAKVEGHKDVIEADDMLVGCIGTFEELKARRSRAEIVIDVFRTLEASRRKT